MKVVVLHRGYGCETGCCGHVVRVSDGNDSWDAEGEQIGPFEFEHPFGDNEEERKEWAVDFARRAVERKYGEGHIFDLDWEHCYVTDNC